MNIIKFKKLYFLVLAVFFVLFVFLFKDIKRVVRYYYLQYTYGQYVNNGICPNCAILFTDGISQHNKAYQKEGIVPQRNDKGLINLLDKGVLVKLKASDALHISQMPYSKPFVLPKCRDFVRKLSQEYEDSCRSRQLRAIPIELSSGTRTLESVARLRKNNANAIGESAHLKGKTFDVNYRKFGKKNKRQVELFVKILHKYNQLNQCYVKFERNGCLHITVN